MSKKLINQPSDCVDEALEGLVMTRPGIRLLGNQRVVVQESVSHFGTRLFTFRVFPSWNSNIVHRYVVSLRFSCTYLYRQVLRESNNTTFSSSTYASHTISSSCFSFFLAPFRYSSKPQAVKLPSSPEEAEDTNLTPLVREYNTCAAPR